MQLITNICLSELLIHLPPMQGRLTYLLPSVSISGIWIIIRYILQNNIPTYSFIQNRFEIL